MTSLLPAFNDHFIEFVSDIHRVFPEDVDILSAKNSFIALRKMNPKLIILSWKSFVVDKYKDSIDRGDISFFINKDYFQDVNQTPHAEKITEAINRLRNPVKAMTADDQAKIMKYIQNLTKLCLLYCNMQ